MTTGDLHKKSCRSVQQFKSYVRGQTDKQTNCSQYSAPLPGRSNNKHARLLGTVLA